ncbi:elongation factor G [Oleidesulfovibrio sp.]|uniref:elongation factor G n=1 Tax=Oleidesulfovibrio sp. TaxID=2909707 RepID=UPI003A8C57FA
MTAKDSSSYLKSLRNIGIIAHIDAGKTTLTERFLYYADKIHRMGEVHEGTATMDYLPEEQERGITITSACTSCRWAGYDINIIDTPGHVDFTIEVERSLRVLDGAVGVFCAVGGVEPQSETVWRQSERFKVPKLAFINKMDRIGADFEGVLNNIRTRLKAKAVAVQIPVGQGEEFEAVIDLIAMQRINFDSEDYGKTYTYEPLSENELALAEPWREKLLEALADFDDALLEAYLGGEEISSGSLIATIRQATLSLQLVPVFTGSALRNTGVQPLMDGVCRFLPGPQDVVAPYGLLGEERVPVEITPDGPFSALVFKVIMEGSRPVAFLRLYSGTLSEGAACWNCAQSGFEKASQLFKLHAGRRERVEQAKAGDIIAVVGFKKARTGDSLADKEHPVVLENIQQYRPVISLALEPRNSEEGDKLDEVLERVLVEDPTLTLEHDEDSGQRVLSGMGELHLEVVLERLKREYGVSPRAGNPQVVYQETIRKAADGVGIFDRELGDIKLYGHVSVSVLPLGRDEGIIVESQVTDESIPDAWLADAIQGVKDSLQSGVLKGYPVQDIKVAVCALQRKEGFSSSAGYRMAAVAAVKNALALAEPVLLEPIMAVEISVPADFVGDAISLLGAKGGRIEDMLDQAGVKIVRGFAPMRMLFGFTTQLRSATQGRAALVLKFHRFDMLQ